MLKIENLSYSVNDVSGQKKDILKKINFSFQKGKIYVITGPNGSGKSTLAKLIMGILNATEGTIYWDNKPINSLSITERAKLGISFAFQKPVTFKGIKIRRLLDIASGRENNVGQVCDYLSMVGLCAKDYIDRPFDDKLSGGEQKRIELALTIARNGLLNIFDEPEAGIDIWSFEKLTDIFKNMSHSINIIVSHQRKILEIADQIILLEKGEVQKVGTYKEVSKYLDSAVCGKLGGKHE